MGNCGKRKYKKKCCKSKKYSNSSCYDKRYKRDKIVRTTKCQGGCLPTNAQIAQATQPFGGVYTQTCDSVVGRGVSACNGCNLGNGIRGVNCGMDPRFDPLTSGARYGSTETHLHVDRLGNLTLHSHPGGDFYHSHDSCGEDHYIGRVSDSRALTTNPDCLDEDVLGGIAGACGQDSHCAPNQRCVSGVCTNTPSTANLDSIGATKQLRYMSTLGSTRCGLRSYTNNLSSCGLPGGVRPYNGNRVGGFRDTVGCGVGCNSCQLTSASFCNGNTLGHCNVACSVPAPGNTLPPSALNLGAKTPDLRGYRNLGASCITASMCKTKRPTVCKTKIKEVYRC